MSTSRSSLHRTHSHHRGTAPNTNSDSNSPRTATCPDEEADASHRGEAAHAALRSDGDAVAAASQALLMGFTEEEIAQARAALAEAGYPGHTAEDVANVLEQAGRQRSTSGDTSIDKTTTSITRSGSHAQRRQGGEDIAVDAADAPPGSLPAAGSPHIAPPANAVAASQRPPWDTSTRPRERAEAAMERQESHLRHRNAVAAAAAATGRGSRDSGAMAYPLQAYAAASARVAVDSPAALLPPSARLQRYVKHYERALKESRRRHPYLPATAGHPNNTSNDSAHVAAAVGATARQPFPVRGTGAVQAADGRAARVLEMPLQSSLAPQQSRGSTRHSDPHGGQQSTSPGPSPRTETEGLSSHQPDAAQRRAANVIYAKTGDPRYRFNLLAGDTLGDAPPSSSSAFSFASSSSSVRLRRLAHEPQVFPRKYNPNPVDRQSGHILSPYAVRYLSTDGSTLPQKADPVARGQQMRALWHRDAFLVSQAKYAASSPPPPPS